MNGGFRNPEDPVNADRERYPSYYCPLKLHVHPSTRVLGRERAKINWDRARQWATGRFNQGVCLHPEKDQLISLHIVSRLSMFCFEFDQFADKGSKSRMSK